ncbi:MAG: carnitine dehydratase [Shinella sp.]|nr:MAG: carnitine dehydratase [Shinella sp.]
MTQNPGLLSGVTVIDLTRVLAGPYASMLLADLGARVIKVEAPESGDDSRGFGPMHSGTSTYFASVNRGKESIALDLKAEDDRAILFDLLERADVLIENFRPGVMERLGLDWPALESRFPRLIYASVSGFGQTGPYRDRAAYDIVVQAMSGMMSVTGFPGAPPARVGTSLGDIGAGTFLALGISAALFSRERTGKGGMIDVGMLDCQIALHENAITRHVATGEVPGPMGNKHPLIAPFQAFRTADTWIVIAAGNDKLFRTFTNAIGRPELAGNPLFVSRLMRQRHHQALEIEIEQTLTTRTRDEWLALLQAAGIPCGPINTIADLIHDPQVKARNMVCETRNSTGETFAVSGNPIKFSAFADTAKRGPVPDLDQDRERILAELYGKGD